MLPPADTSADDRNSSLLPPPAPLDGFFPEEFRRRRDALRAACPDGMVLIRGATEEEFSDGSAQRYRQDNSFFYLTGVETPGCFLVLLPPGLRAGAALRGEERDVREILFIPPRDADRELWTGPKLGPGEETEKLTGFAATAAAGKLTGALTIWLKRNPLLYTLSPYGERALDSWPYSLMRRVAERVPVVQFRDCTMALAALRVVKSPAELERIGQAVAITNAGQRAARAAIADGAGKREFQIEARIYESFRSQGATLAFGSIVGGGANATVLHYEQNAAPLQTGHLVVVDIGARNGFYCGDVTRTYPVGGSFTPRQREIYELVLKAHRHAVSSYRPGDDRMLDLTKRVKDFLKESELRSTDASGEEHTMEHFMPHSLGHHLGMDVHDVGDTEMPLAPGNVVTIEPGLYLPGEGIGVRIEDDYLVTPNGLELIGSPLEADCAAIMAAMQH